jgi:uncharacterized protein YdhG (YjbR/CyaY superfamily)
MNDIETSVKRATSRTQTLPKQRSPVPKKADRPAFSTVDEYIASFPAEVQTLLNQIRKTILDAAPGASEKISWGMPTFWLKKNLIHFAAFKKHIGIYPGDLSLLPFQDRLSAYSVSKGGVRLPLDKPIPFELIAEITRYRFEQVTSP